MLGVMVQYSVKLNSEYYPLLQVVPRFAQNCTPCDGGYFKEHAVKFLPIVNNDIVAIIDDCDYEKLKNYRWYVNKRERTLYVRTTILVDGKLKPKSLHRIIMGDPKGFCVDHINHDGLDNRRCNLRIATQSQNCMNRLPYKEGSSRFKGVRWHKQNKLWEAVIWVKPKSIYLGCFTDEIAGAKAYDIAARKYFGEFASLNFPKEGEGSADESI